MPTVRRRDAPQFDGRGVLQARLQAWQNTSEKAMTEPEKYARDLARHGRKTADKRRKARAITARNRALTQAEVRAVSKTCRLLRSAAWGQG
jgi:hypothetical protein